MQQVAYKEGFMKGSVQLCRNDKTPAPAKLEKCTNSIPAKKVTYLIILCVSNSNANLVFDC